LDKRLARKLQGIYASLNNREKTDCEGDCQDDA
jgi:hypothetical protein